jgi:hypothetical protein
MRLTVALAGLAISLALGGCSRPNQMAYAMPLPSPRLSHSIKASLVNPSDSKFKAAQAKAEKIGIDKLTREDIKGLSDEQIKQLRGY